jgi:hypothetical protein
MKTTKPPPGRPPKHGARALERLLQQNKLDKRTRTAKLLQSIANDLAADAGGWAHLTAREKLLVERCAAQALIVASLEGWVFQQASLIDAGGEMLGVLRKGYTAHVAALARNLVALGLKPNTAKKLPTLGEYLASRQSGAESDAPAAGSPSPQPSGDR